MKLINIGNDMFIDSESILILGSMETKAGKQLYQENKAKAYNVAARKKRKAIIVLKDKRTFLSSVSVDTLIKRIENKKKIGEE